MLLLPVSHDLGQFFRTSLTALALAGSTLASSVTMAAIGKSQFLDLQDQFRQARPLEIANLPENSTWTCEGMKQEKLGVFSYIEPTERFKIRRAVPRVNVLLATYYSYVDIQLIKTDGEYLADYDIGRYYHYARLAARMLDQETIILEDSRRSLHEVYKHYVKSVIDADIPVIDYLTCTVSAESMR